MKIIHCPQNGPRNMTEFTFAGAVEATGGSTSTDNPANPQREWAESIFFKENSTGVVTELWRHNPSAFWICIERSRTTDEILRTYPATQAVRELL